MEIVGNECPGAQDIRKLLSVFWRAAFEKAAHCSNEGFCEYKRTLFHKIFCLGKYNRKNMAGKELRTLWDVFEYKPISAFIPFKTDTELINLWKTYQINEIKDRGYFRSKDRLKIIDSILTRSINVYKLMSKQMNFVVDYMPLHDPYALNHKRKLPLFSEIRDVLESCQRPDIDKIYDYVMGLTSEEEKIDFLQKPVKDILKFRPMEMISFDINPIQGYFGERIALYFLYLRSFTNGLKLIALFGAIVYFSEREVTNRIVATTDEEHKKDLITAFHFIKVIYSFGVVIWNTWFIEHWKRQQAFFSITYGVYDESAPPRERPGFKGKMIRDLGSSEKNLKYYPSFKTKMKQMISFFMSFVIVLASVVCTVAILIFKEYLANQNSFLVSVLPTALNIAAAKFFTFIYDMMKKKLNKLENHKSSQDYENSMIIKIFMFNFFNQFNSFFVIAFVKPNTTLLGKCTSVNSNILVLNLNGEKELCNMEVLEHTRSYFMITFLTNFTELIIPILIQIFFKRNLKVQRDYPWGKIDRIIENEFEKRDPYRLTAEIDGVLEEYLEVILLFGFLSMFGHMAPMGFFMSLLTMVTEIFIDKYKILYLVRRPVPQRANNIGSWMFILQLLAFASIFVNVMFLSFSSRSLEIVLSRFGMTEDNLAAQDSEIVNGRNTQFVVVALSMLFIKSIIEASIDDVPENVMKLKMREQQIANTKMSHMIGSGNFKLARGGMTAKWREKYLNRVINPKTIF